MSQFSHEREYSVWLLRQKVGRFSCIENAMCKLWPLIYVLAEIAMSSTIVRADATQNLAQLQSLEHGHPFESEPRKWCARHLMERKYAFAVMDCSLAIKKGDQKAESFSNLSAALIFLKQFVEAEAAATEAIIVDPSNAIHYFNRGLSFDRRGLFREAISNYSDAIRLDPRLVSAYMNRGLAWRRLGEYENAQKDILRARNILELGRN